jgi:ribose-phosphate pyrophosphokinase
VRSHKLCSAIQQTFPNLEKVTIVSPDVGGVVRARNLAKRLGVGIAIVDKRRSQPGVVDNMEIIGDVNGKICLICDDICDTAGTLVKAADCLKEHGSIAVHAYVSHGVLSEPAVERISTSELSSFTMTDSIDASEKIKNSEKIPSKKQKTKGIRSSDESYVKYLCEHIQILCNRTVVQGRNIFFVK